MALVLNDRVKETSTTTGTGTFSLGGAVDGFETFVVGIADGNTTYYAAVNRDANEFEVGIGTVGDASPDTLARTTIISSSNSDSAVDFSAGTKDIFVTLPASKVAFEDASNDVTIGNDLILGSDSAVLKFGADSDTTLTHTDGTGLTLNSTNKLLFRDTGLYINSSTDGQLDLVADTEIQIAATTIDINGNVEISGDLTVSGDDITMGTNTSGNILVADGTNFNSIAATDLLAISTIASGDTLLAVDASGGGLKKVARSVLVAGLATTSALNNISEDDTPQLGGNLDMNGSDIVTTSNATIDLAPNGTGTVVVRGNTNSGAIVFNCESNSHGQTIIAQPHSASATNTMLLPEGANSTLVSLVSTDTLTNKTLTSPKINEDVAVTATASELNILDGVTSTAAELNILDGVTSTAAELNILDTVTAVAGELNALDLGSTAVGTAIASKAVILDSNKDYTGLRNFTVSGELDAATGDFSGDVDVDGTLEADAITINGTAIASVLSPIAGGSGIVTTGALNSGSITSGFGTIDTGASAITTTGLISGGSLDIDNVLINGTTIGHTDDTDLITVAADLVTVAGEVQMTTLDIGGTNVTATAAEINYSDLATLGTTAASKVFSADANNLTAISGAVVLTEDTLSFDATQDWDVRASPNAKVTLTANVTFDAPTNPTTGQYIAILCIQDAGGTNTIAWNAVFEFTGDEAPTATTTGARGDLFTFRYNGAKWLEVGRNLNLVLS